MHIGFAFFTGFRHDENTRSADPTQLQTFFHPIHGNCFAFDAHPFPRGEKADQAIKFVKVAIDLQKAYPSRYGPTTMKPITAHPDRPANYIEESLREPSRPGPSESGNERDKVLLEPPLLIAVPERRMTLPPPSPVTHTAYFKEKTMPDGGVILEEIPRSDWPPDIVRMEREKKIALGAVRNGEKRNGTVRNREEKKREHFVVLAPPTFIPTPPPLTDVKDKRHQPIHIQPPTPPISSRRIKRNMVPELQTYPPPPEPELPQAMNIDIVKEIEKKSSIAQDLGLPQGLEYLAEQPGYGTMQLLLFQRGSMLSSVRLVKVGYSESEFYSLQQEIVDTTRYTVVQK